MKKLLYFTLMPLLAFIATGCDDEDAENMLWEIVSNSAPEMIEVANQSTTNIDSPSIIWIKAGYNGGDLVLKCTNHNIAYTLIGPDEGYINQEGAFSISKASDNAILIHFEEYSGDTEYTDQITVTNTDTKHVVCNTFIYITRTSGESESE